MSKYYINGRTKDNPVYDECTLYREKQPWNPTDMFKRTCSFMNADATARECPYNTCSAVHCIDKIKHD